MNRRSYLASVGTVATGLLAGCSNKSNPFEYTITQSSDVLSIKKLTSPSAFKDLHIYVSNTKDRAEHIILAQPYTDNIVKNLGYGQTNTLIETQEFSDTDLNEATILLGKGGTEENLYNDMTELARLEFTFYNTNNVSYGSKNVTTNE